MSDTDQLQRRVLELAAQLDSLTQLVGRFVDATADNFEQLQHEDSEIRDGLVAVSNRLEGLTRAVTRAEAGGNVRAIGDGPDREGGR